MRWAESVALWGKIGACTGFWWGNVRERVHLEDQSLDRRIIVMSIIKKCDVEAWIGSSWLRIGTGGGHL